MLVASVIILVLTLRTPSADNQLTQGEQKSDSVLMARSQADSLMRQAQTLSSHVFNAVTVTSSEFGFVLKDQPKSVPLFVKVLFNNKHLYRYLLISDTLILVGNFDINYIGDIYNLPRRYIADYNDTLYRIDKKEQVLLPLEREFDPRVIQGIQELKEKN